MEVLLGDDDSLLLLEDALEAAAIELRVVNEENCDDTFR